MPINFRYLHCHTNPQNSAQLHEIPRNSMNFHLLLCPLDPSHSPSNLQPHRRRSRWIIALSSTPTRSCVTDVLSVSKFLWLLLLLSRFCFILRLRPSDLKTAFCERSFRQRAWAFERGAVIIDLIVKVCNLSASPTFHPLTCFWLCRWGLARPTHRSPRGHAGIVCTWGTTCGQFPQ